ncbi:MAG: ACT domain-containing protein, partial [bacterium]
AESLIAQVGYGKMTSREVLTHLAPDVDLDGKPAAQGRLKRILRTVAGKPPAGGVRVSSLPDVLVRFARCCDPLAGERITGFVTRGRGVTVHATGCPRVLEADPLRRVDCVWDDAANAPRPVRVEVGCIDQPGQLAAISKAIAAAGINIRKAESRAIADAAVEKLRVSAQPQRLMILSYQPCGERQAAKPIGAAGGLWPAPAALALAVVGRSAERCRRP